MERVLMAADRLDTMWQAESPTLALARKMLQQRLGAAGLQRWHSPTPREAREIGAIV